MTALTFLRRRPPSRVRLAAVLQAVLLPVLFVAAWQVWASTLPPDSHAPSPTRVIQAFVALTASGDLPSSTLASLGRVLTGFSLALVAGVGLGTVMGMSRTMRASLDPIVEGFRPIAPMAILPIAILWLGTGTPTALAIVSYAAFFPILLNTVMGVVKCDRKLLNAARTMGVPRRAILLRVVLPSASPSIMLGARLGMGVAWTAIIAAELAVGAKSGGGSSGGIGQMMFVFYSYSTDLNGIVVCMIVVGIVALLIDRLFRLADRHLMPWRH